MPEDTKVDKPEPYLYSCMLLYLKWDHNFEKIGDDACEVNVADDHDVKVPEQLQLFQRDARLRFR